MPAIIRAARAHKDEIGCVLEADIYKPDFDLRRRPAAAARRGTSDEGDGADVPRSFAMHRRGDATGGNWSFLHNTAEKDLPHDPNIFVSYTLTVSGRQSGRRW